MSVVFLRVIFPQWQFRPDPTPLFSCSRVHVETADAELCMRPASCLYCCSLVPSAYPVHDYHFNLVSIRAGHRLCDWSGYSLHLPAGLRKGQSE